MNELERGRLRRHLRLIDDDVRPVVERFADDIQCRPGCSDCCHQSFTVSEPEGALLREGLATLPPETRAQIQARAEGYVPDQRQPCPVLDGQGQCQLYDHRPRICRKYGIPLWHPDRPNEVRCCPLNFREQADIDPTLILEPQARWAEDWIGLREELGVGAGPGRTIAEHLRRSSAPPLVGPP